MPQVTQQRPAKKRPVKKTPNKPTQPRTQQTKPTTSATNKNQNQDGMVLVVHGQSGVGKTSFVGQFPKPWFVINKHDRGAIRLAKRGLIPKPVGFSQTDKWEDIYSLVSLSQRDDVGTVIIDTVTGIEKLCFHHVADRDYEGDTGESGFWSWGHQGAKKAANREWMDLLDILTDLSISGKNVILVCHTASRRFKNPSGLDFDRWTPRLHDATWEVTYGWAESVLFLHYDIEIKKEGLRNKATSGDNRYIYTQWDSTFDAKNQLGITNPMIDMGSSGKEAYDNFMKELQ